jgi:hypothetical protein
MADSTRWRTFFSYSTVPVEARDLTAIQLAHQVLLVSSYQLDQMILQRFFLRKRFAFQDGLLGQIGVAAPFGHQASKQGRGIVLDLLFHDRIHFRPEQDRMSCAGVSAGRHGRDIAGLEQKKAG